MTASSDGQRADWVATIHLLSPGKDRDGGEEGKGPEGGGGSLNQQQMELRTAKDRPKFPVSSRGGQVKVFIGTTEETGQGGNS